MNKLDKKLLNIISGIDNKVQGAYNIRKDGKEAERLIGFTTEDELKTAEAQRVMDSAQRAYDAEKTALNREELC